MSTSMKLLTIQRLVEETKKRHDVLNPAGHDLTPSILFQMQSSLNLIIQTHSLTGSYVDYELARSIIDILMSAALLGYCFNIPLEEVIRRRWNEISTLTGYPIKINEEGEFYLEGPSKNKNEPKKDLDYH